MPADPRNPSRRLKPLDLTSLTLADIGCAKLQIQDGSQHELFFDCMMFLQAARDLLLREGFAVIDCRSSGEGEAYTVTLTVMYQPVPVVDAEQARLMQRLIALSRKAASSFGPFDQRRQQFSIFANSVDDMLFRSAKIASEAV